jgi:hypothetical protein
MFIYLLFKQKFWEELLPTFLWQDTNRIQSMHLCMFVVAVTFLPSQCQAELEGYKYRLMNYTFMKYAFEMSSGTMTYVPNFINNPSGIQKLKEGGGHTYTDIQNGDVIKLLLFFQDKEGRLRAQLTENTLRLTYTLICQCCLGKYSMLVLRI